MLPLLLSRLSSSPQDDAPTLELLNGRWFDGQRFEARTMYAERGMFVAARPATIGRSLAPRTWSAPGPRSALNRATS